MPDARSRRRRDKRKARVARPPRVKHLYFLTGAAIGAIGGGIAAIAWMGANNPDAIAPGHAVADTGRRVRLRRGGRRLRPGRLPGSNAAAKSTKIAPGD